MNRKCKAPNCAREVADGRLMCARHWFCVPGHIQRSIRRSWDRVCEERTRENINLYHAAVANAVAHVTPRRAAK